MNDSPIEHRALAFAMIYCVNGHNAAQAAQAVLGCSPRDGKRMGWAYLRRADVRAHVRAEQARTVARAQLSRDALLAVLESALRTDVVRDIYACMGDPLSIPHHARAAIRKLKTRITEAGAMTHEIELHTPVEIAERLLKLQGLDAPQRVDLTARPGAQRNDADEWRDGLTDDELATWALAKRAGRADEVTSWEALGRHRLAEALRAIEAERST